MSLARLFRATLFAGLAVALAGCPPQYPKCREDKHCEAKGEVCVDEFCRECGTDAHCREGFQCRDFACVPIPVCRVDGDCGEGRRCRQGQCVPECESDRECAAAEQCEAGRCVERDTCTSDEQCGPGRRCEEGRCASLEAGATGAGEEDEAAAARRRALEQCQLERVRFDFNAFSLSDDARQSLDRAAECIRFRNRPVVLAGHADERGTEEYNLVLAERRANAAKRYLISLGLDERRLQTISYGEEKPLDPGQNEAAWAANRRVELSFR